MTTIRNLTPHNLVVLVEDEAGDIVGSLGYGRATREAKFRLVAELPSEGVARATTTVETVGWTDVNGTSVPVTRTSFGQPEGLPEPDLDGGILLVVSLLTANAAAAAGRTTDDLLVVGETVRDADGKIVGTTGFGAV